MLGDGFFGVFAFLFGVSPIFYLMIDLGGSFGGRGAQRRVAQFFLKRGIRVSKDGVLLANDVEVSLVSVARVLGVDRRVVRSAVDAIVGDERLFSIYSRLAVTPSLREIAPLLGFGAVEIVPDDAAGKGIVAGVTKVISDYGIGIRQVVADDPMFDNPELTVVTQKPIPRELIDMLLKVKGVRKVVVLS